MKQRMYESFSDEHLVKLAQQRDSGAIETLTTRYEVIVQNLYRPFFFRKYGEDLLGELWIAFMELIYVYPVDGRSFREMVINRLYFRRLNYYKNEKKRAAYEFSYAEWDDAHLINRNDNASSLDYEELRQYLQISKPAVRIIEAIEAGASTLTEIARYLGISPQSVHEILLKLRQKARLYQKNF